MSVIVYIMSVVYFLISKVKVACGSCDSLVSLPPCLPYLQTHLCLFSLPVPAEVQSVSVFSETPPSTGGGRGQHPCSPPACSLAPPTPAQSLSERITGLIRLLNTLRLERYDFVFYSPTRVDPSLKTFPSSGWTAFWEIIKPVRLNLEENNQRAGSVFKKLPETKSL